MATATFRLFRLTVPELVAKVRDVIAKLIANAATYATPNPPLPILTSQVDALDLSYQEALGGDRFKKEQMRLDRAAMMTSMSKLQTYVQLTSGGDPAKIILVADLKRPRTPAGIKPAPANVRAKFGFQSGEIRLLYGGVSGRIFYRVQINPTPGNNAAWADYVQTTKTRVLISGQVSGQEYGIRIATVTADGMGEWSDAVIQKAL